MDLYEDMMSHPGNIHNLSSSNILSVIYSFAFFIFYGCIMNSQCHQLPDGVIAQLVEYRTGSTEVMGSNPVQT